MAGQTIERRLRGEEEAEASEERERRESGGGEEGVGASDRTDDLGRQQRRKRKRTSAREEALRADEEAAPTSDDLEMERQLEGEADLPTAGDSPRCDPVGDDEDEMSICDAVDEAETGSNTISPAARGEALDDEAPAAMAAGGEASSSAPGGETVLGRREREEALDDEAPTVMAEDDEASSSAPKAKKQRGQKRGGRKNKMGAHQRSDEIRRESQRAGGDRDEW